MRKLTLVLAAAASLLTLGSVASAVPAGAATAAPAAGHVSKCSNAHARAIKVKTNTPKFGGLTVRITADPGHCWLRAGGTIRSLSDFAACQETDIVPIRSAGNHERLEPQNVQGCPFIVTPGDFVWTRWGVWYNNAKGHRVFKQSGHRSVPAVRGSPSRRTGGCAARSSCFYPQVNFGGTPLTVLNTTNENTWTSVPAGDREAVVSQGGSDLWLWQRTDKIYVCVPANGGSISDEDPFNSGWYYIDYGVTGCTETHPSGAPGSGPDKPLTTSVILHRAAGGCSAAHIRAIRVKTNNPKLADYSITIRKNPGRCWIRAKGYIRQISVVPLACQYTDHVAIRNVGNHEGIDPANNVQSCDFVPIPDFNFYWASWGIGVRKANGKEEYDRLGHRSVPARARLASSRRWSCGDGYGCMYDCVDPGFDVQMSQNQNTWLTIPSADRGCATNKSTAYNLWTVNHTEDIWTCFKAYPGSPYKGTTLAAGYAYVNGSGGCQDCPPALMGQSCPGPQHGGSRVTTGRTVRLTAVVRR